MHRHFLASVRCSEAHRAEELSYRDPSRVLPVLQLSLSEIEPFKINQVEHFINKSARHGLAHSPLKFLKTRSSLRINDDNLAVENRAGHLKRFDRFDDVQELLCPVFAVSAPESHTASVDPTEHSIAIKLQLVKPLVTGWWVFY